MSGTHNRQTHRRRNTVGSVAEYQQSFPEGTFSIDYNGVPNPNFIHTHQLQPASHNARSRNLNISSGHAPSSFRSPGGTPEAWQSEFSQYPFFSPNSSPNHRKTDYISTWIAEQPFLQNDALEYYPHLPIAPSFAHAGLARGSPQEHVYIPAYERNKVPAWKENQYSGEFRRQELDDMVSRDDYVRIAQSPVRSGTGGSQGSRGSARSTASTSRATAGSPVVPGQDAIGQCEFCGRLEPVSTLKEHWLSCDYRSPTQGSRRGSSIWMNRRR